MSTPNNPYAPKKPLPKPPGKSPRETLYPKNYIPDIKDHVVRGGITTVGILASTIAVKKFKKDMAPDFTIKNSFPLLTVVVLSSYLIDWLQRYEYIPYSI